MCTGTGGSCFGVGISNLTLVGLSTSTTIDGIDNLDSEEGSFVEHVNMYDIGGTGLYLGSISGGGTSSHSGPYSDIFFYAGPAAASGTACVRIVKADPRAIRDITCDHGTSTTASEAAIYLDGSNVSLEDIHMEGFGDGIVVGESGVMGFMNVDALTNVVSNVSGVTSSNGTMTNVIHICKPNDANGACSTAPGLVRSLSLQGISAGSGVNSIVDDLTGVALTNTTVGLYVIGDTVGGSGLSRFTTSPQATTWGVGSAAPTSTSCTVGSLYSNTSGSPFTLYVCIPGGTGTWFGIK
jgi:hypothetical protein